MKLSLAILSLLFISSSAFSADSTPANELQSIMKQQLALNARLIPGISTAQEVTEIRAQKAALRYRASQIAEAQAGNTQRALSEASPASFSKDQIVTLNPAFDKLEFRSGDIFLVRGRTTVSTAIATITDQPSQFSHTFMIYLNPEDQKMYAIEALMDQGVIVHPFEETLTEGLSRMNIYRYKDAAVANAAAKIEFDRAMAAIRSGTRIPYAHSLVLDTSFNSVTCSQEVSSGFFMASNGSLKFPSFESTLGAKFPNLIEALGIAKASVLPVIWPADYDTTEGLTLVAESIDPRASFNYRIKDQIILSLFTWIEEGSVGRDFTRLISLAKAELAQKLNAQSGPAGTVKLTSPTNPPSQNSQVELMGLFASKANDVVNALTTQILAANQKQLAKSGRNMSEAELSLYMESVRHSPFVENLLHANGFSPKAGSCQDLFGAH